MEPLYFRNLNLYSQQNISYLQCLKYFTLFKKKLVPIKHLSVLWGVWSTHFTDIIITEAAHLYIYLYIYFFQIIPFLYKVINMDMVECLGTYWLALLLGDDPLVVHITLVAEDHFVHILGGMLQHTPQKNQHSGQKKTKNNNKKTHYK